MSRESPTRSEMYAIMFLVKRGILKFELSPNPHPQSIEGNTIDFVKDPETIKKAVEGSMDKRIASMPDIREQLAAIEHERWSDWQTWVHKVINEGVEGTTLEQFMERWERQINTPYAELSEAEKNSDREQVDRYLPLISQTVSSAEKAARIDELERLEWNDAHLYIHNRLAELRKGDQS